MGPQWLELAPFEVPHLEESGPGKGKLGVELEQNMGIEMENPNMI